MPEHLDLHESTRAAIRSVIAEMETWSAEFERDALARLDGFERLLKDAEKAQSGIGAAEARLRDAQHAQEKCERELAECRGRLEAQQREIESAAQRLEAQQTRFDHELSTARDALAAAQTQLAAAQQECHAAQQRFESTTAELRSAQARVAELSAERDRWLAQSAEPHDTQALAEAQQQALQLRTELDASRAQVARLANTAIELAEARQQILELRSELAQAPLTASEDYSGRIADLERERTELELELEAVRRRAAELLEDLESQRHQSQQREAEIADERARWASELRQLRRALEVQAEALAERETRVAPAPIASQREQPDCVPLSKNHASVKVADPVLNTVMAQFQQLQKDRIERRVKSKNQQEVA